MKPKKTDIGNMEMRLIGHVAVDSGQIIVCDPVWLGDFTQTKVLPFKSKFRGGFQYFCKGCCQAALSKGQAGQLKLNKWDEDGISNPHVGIAVDTRYGDGLYPVYGYYMGGRIAAVLVDFYVEELGKIFKENGGKSHEKEKI